LKDENNRDCHITMPLSLKTMGGRLKGTSDIRGLERCRSTGILAVGENKQGKTNEDKHVP